MLTTTNISSSFAVREKTVSRFGSKTRGGGGVPLLCQQFGGHVPLLCQQLFWREVYPFVSSSSYFKYHIFCTHLLDKSWSQADVVPSVFPPVRRAFVFFGQKGLSAFPLLLFVDFHRALCHPDVPFTLCRTGNIGIGIGFADHRHHGVVDKLLY